MVEPAPKTLFVFDIDGTLLNTSHQILASTARGLRSLLQQGHVVVPASARPPKSVQEISRMIGAKGLPAITLNGAFVSMGDDVLSERSLDRSSLQPLMEEARKRKLQINLFSHWEWYVEDENEWSEFEANILGYGPRVVPNLFDVIEDGGHKLMLLGDPNAIVDYRDWARNTPLPIAATLSKASYCEVVQAGVSKAKALRDVANRLAIKPANVVAFGDGENDIEMLETAGTGVAMGNASPELLQAADLVTDSNDDDGIVHALSKLGFIG